MKVALKEVRINYNGADLWYQHVPNIHSPKYTEKVYLALLRRPC